MTVDSGDSCAPDGARGRPRHPALDGEPRASRAQRVRSVGLRAVRMELRVYESLWRMVARRPKIAPGATGFRYHGPVLTILIVFIALSTLEIPIVDLIVNRWPPVRIGFLILGIWGVTWMLGLLFAYFTRPHTVGPDGIRVREGMEIDLHVPWDDFASIEIMPTRVESVPGQRKPSRVFEEDGERICAIRIGSETNIEVRFERPLVLSLPGMSPRGGEHEVDALRFWADDPKALLAEVRAQLS